ncbi:unnamed protein product [Prunus brigantina]
MLFSYGVFNMVLGKNRDIKPLLLKFGMAFALFCWISLFSSLLLVQVYFFAAPLTDTRESVWYLNSNLVFYLYFLSWVVKYNMVLCLYFLSWDATCKKQLI